PEGVAGRLGVAGLPELESLLIVGTPLQDAPRVDQLELVGVPDPADSESPRRLRCSLRSARMRSRPSGCPPSLRSVGGGPTTPALSPVLFGHRSHPLLASHLQPIPCLDRS